MSAIGADWSFGSSSSSKPLAVPMLPLTSVAVAVTASSVVPTGISRTQPSASAVYVWPPIVSVRVAIGALSVATTRMSVLLLAAAGLLENSIVTVGAVVSSVTVSVNVSLIG